MRTQQKSDRRVVAQGGPKAVPTRGPQGGGGGGAKATTVAESAGQLELRLGTAENQSAQAPRTNGGAVAENLSATAPLVEPRPNRKKEKVLSATMEEMASRLQARKLISLGVGAKTAWRDVYGGKKSIWDLSHSGAVNGGLRNAYFAERGPPIAARPLARQSRDHQRSGCNCLAAGITRGHASGWLRGHNRSPEEPCVNSTRTVL